MIYSLFATCKKHDVNPHEWLLDTLRKLNDPGYEGKFSDLLPNKPKSSQNSISWKSNRETAECLQKKHHLNYKHL